MKKIKIILLVLILLVLIICIWQSKICALKQRDMPYWGRYVFASPKLDIAVGGLEALSTSKSKAVLIDNDKVSNWLNLKGSVGRVNFCNMDWDDLICDFCQSGAIKTGLKGDTIIPKKDDYLVFSTVNSKIDIFKNKTSIIDIIKPRRISNKWSFFGRVNLEEGTYNIRLRTDEKIILIPKSVYRLWYKRIKKFILGNDISTSYLFNNKKNIYVNIFQPNTKADLRMKIVPKLDKMVTINKSLVIKANELLKCKYIPNNITKYVPGIDEDGNFNVEIFFDGDSEEDEYVKMELENREVDIDLLENPYLGIRYKVEDPEIETVQIVLGIDFNKDKKPDAFFEDIHTAGSKGLWSEYVYPVYNALRERYPGKEYMHAVLLEIYPHKMWWADCGGEKKSMYRFWIKDLYFFDKIESKEIYFLDTPIINYSDLYTWDTNILKSKPAVDNRWGKARIIEQWEVDFSRDIPQIDLREYPWLRFDFPASNGKQLDAICLSLSLDFNGDEKIDNELTIKEDTIMFSPVNLFEIAEKLFPGQKFYRLVKVYIKFIFREYPRCEDIQFGSFILFRKENIDIKNTVFEGGFFSLDNKTFKADEPFKGKESCLSARAFLEKGRHKITDILNNVYFKSNGFIVEVGNKNVEGGAAPEVIGISRLNPTLYNVKAKGDNVSFWLVFNEYYHPGWKLYLVQNNTKTDNIDKYYSWSTLLYTLRMKGKLKEITSHWLVNNCANAWLVNKIGDEELDMLIVFEPQKRYELALLATGISILGCVLGIWRLRRYR